MQQFDESRAKTRPIYYPNNIGIATPGNKSTYSFLIDGKTESGVELMFVLAEFLRCRARIISHTSWVFDSVREFTISVICDLKDSKETSDDLIIKLRGLRFVKNAKAISLKRRMFTGSLFPLTMMDTSRVVAVNPEGFFRIQDHLKTHAKKSDLVDAGRDIGKDIVSQIREKFEASNMNSVPNLDDVIKDNVIGFMSAAGWGKFSWDQNKDNTLRVLIRDPPTVSYGGTAAGNYFLHGIVAGLTEEFFHKTFNVMEDHYDNENRLLSLSLLELDLTSAGSMVQGDQLSNQDKAVALMEVKKIIQSLENGVSAPVMSNIELEQTRREGVSLVVPAIALSGQVDVRTAIKNDFPPKMVEKEMPVLSYSTPDVRTIEDSRMRELGRNPSQSQKLLDQRKSPPRTETFHFIPLLRRLFALLGKLFHSSSKGKQLTFEPTDKNINSNVNSSSPEQVMQPTDATDVKRTSEVKLGNTKFEEKGITPKSPENSSSEISIVEATQADNIVNRLEVDASPDQPIHLERKTAIAKNESYDPENDILSPSSEDEIYYEESFD